MSVQDEPIPPVPEHTPPLREDEVSRDTNKFFNQTWTRWFVSLRDKINVIDESIANLAGVVGNGILVKVGSSWVLRTITGTTGRISVTNGDGAAGNPVVDLVNTGVVAGSYTSANITVLSDGRLSAAANGSGGSGGSNRITTTGDLRSTTQNNLRIT